eukprot:1126784_1
MQNLPNVEPPKKIHPTNAKRKRNDEHIDELSQPKKKSKMCTSNALFQHIDELSQQNEMLRKENHLLRTEGKRILKQYKDLQLKVMNIINNNAINNAPTEIETHGSIAHVLNSNTNQGNHTPNTHDESTPSDTSNPTESTPTNTIHSADAPSNVVDSEGTDTTHPTNKVSGYCIECARSFNGDHGLAIHRARAKAHKTQPDNATQSMNNNDKYQCYNSGCDAQFKSFRCFKNHMSTHNKNFDKEETIDLT